MGVRGNEKRRPCFFVAEKRRSEDSKKREGVRVTYVVTVDKGLPHVAQVGDAENGESVDSIESILSSDNQGIGEFPLTFEKKKRRDIS